MYIKSKGDEMTKEEVLKDLWNSYSKACDTPYKQWVEKGFNWMYGWYECEIKALGIDKNLEIERLHKVIKYLETHIHFCDIHNQPDDDCPCDIKEVPIEHVFEENKNLKEIVSFYADNRNYISKNGGHLENKQFTSPIGRDCGRKARIILKELIK